jgi:glutathione synthase/RimK-type ligase-like ATP-grasp enzyme
MILICGGLADVVTELVCARIEDLGYDYRLLDLGHYPEGYTVTWRWTGGAPHGTVTGLDWTLDIADITGVYVRYLGVEGHAPLATAPDGTATAIIAESQAGLAMLLDQLPCPVANRIPPGMSNQSKPYQALAIREVGLQIPRTLITSDPIEARRFYDELDGEVVFKSLSGIRSVVRRMEPRDLARLGHLRHGPAQFQAFVPGDNIRVHTVGDALFATRCHSDVVDYRYARRQGGTVAMEPAALPSRVAEACRALSQGIGLIIAGIDLKETPDGDYYCFEINPSPGFSWYEQETGQPISAALVEMLRGRS